MIIRKFGIQLRRLIIDDIEQVRNWRNSETVRPFMKYQKIISEEEQLNWFSKINNSNNYYFIMKINNEEVGITQGKEFEEDTGIIQGGVFIGNKNYLNNHLIMACSITHIDFLFFIVGVKSINNISLKTNGPSNSLNTKLGGIVIDEDERFFTYKIEPKSYLEASSIYRNFYARRNQTSEIEFTDPNTYLNQYIIAKAKENALLWKPYFTIKNITR